MSEWWTYRPSDFLMFSARTYWRLFEGANAAAWPLQPALLALALAWWLRQWQALRPRRSGIQAGGMAGHAAAAAVLAACWLWVGLDFLARRYADVNWPAAWFAAAFCAQGLALAVAAVLAARAGLAGVGPGVRRLTGMVLVGWALLGQPLLGVALGRPWGQAELFGIAPDPTAFATLGWLLLVQPVRLGGALRPLCRVLWVVPLAWCAITAATLATLGAGQAVLPIAAAAGALLAAWRGRAPASASAPRPGNKPRP